VTREAFQKQYAAVMKGAGFARLDHWSTVRVTGGDRTSLLHNMCTNDINGLRGGGGCEAFFTDVKGKIVAHAFVLVHDDAIQLVMVPNSAERLIAHLDRYIIREDVQLVDQSADLAWALVVGAKASELTMRPASSPLPDLSGPWSHALASLSQQSLIEAELVHCDLPWCDSYLVGCAQDRVDALQEAFIQEGAVACDSDVWQAIRVESAWPLWGVDFDGSNLPQEIGRDATAIHFRKGCYLGQETIARIDALGHVNKQIVQLRFDGDNVPTPGAALFKGEENVGRITSPCWSPRFGRPLGLAMVKRSATKAGTRLQCDDVEAEVVVPLPSP
jgi:tRNA-modifying protein YgfZ